MNVESYISSGILELFVAGSLSEAEAEEVVSMAEKHPEIQAEIEAIEQSFGEMAAQLAPATLSPDILTGALAQIEAEEKNQTPVIPLTQPQTEFTPEGIKKPSSVWRWVAGILFLASMGANGFLYQRWQSATTEVENLRVRNEVLETEQQETENVLAFYQDPQNLPVPLETPPGSSFPASQLMVYWNEEAASVHLLVQSLPSPGADEQYQLWALQGGNPVDAGVFDVKEGLQAVKSITGNVDAFAVTLEPRGGSKSPTLDKMYAFGDVSSSF